MATDEELDALSEEALEKLLMEADLGLDESSTPLDSASPEGRLLEQAMRGLFSDEAFSGELMTQVFKLGLSEEDMDAIFKRAEDELAGFVSVLSDTGAEKDAPEALEGFLVRLKNQILKNPAIYVEGS